jgi:nicotinamide-nucleotide amidase
MYENNELSGKNEESKAIETSIGELLVEKSLTIATAESCTGGLLAGRLINYPGISSAFLEGFVTYSNEAKINRLGVKEETLQKYGAVSEETAREMVEGLVKTAGTDIGISVTGIAGPGGGSIEKPVGLVYVGFSVKGNCFVRKFNFTGTREQVREQTVCNALEILRAELNKI